MSDSGKTNRGRQRSSSSSSKAPKGDSQVLVRPQTGIENVNLRAVYCRRLSTVIRLHKVSLGLPAPGRRRAQLSPGHHGDYDPFEEDAEISGISLKLRKLLLAALHRRARLLLPPFERLKARCGLGTVGPRGLAELRGALAGRGQAAAAAAAGEEEEVAEGGGGGGPGPLGEVAAHAVHRWLLAHDRGAAAAAAGGGGRGGGGGGGVGAGADALLPRLVAEARSRSRLLRALGLLRLRELAPGEVAYFQSDEVDPAAAHFTVARGEVLLVRLPAARGLELGVMRDARRRGSAFRRTSFLDAGLAACALRPPAGFGAQGALGALAAAAGPGIGEGGPRRVFSARAGAGGATVLCLGREGFRALAAGRARLAAAGEKVGVLRAAGLFGPRATPTQLGLVANELDRRVFRRGTVLTKQGAPALANALLVAGEVFITRKAAAGDPSGILNRNQAAEVLEAWSLLDEEALLLGAATHRSTAVVMSAEAVLYVFRPGVYDLLRPGFQFDRHKDADDLHKTFNDDEDAANNLFTPFGDQRLHIPFLFRNRRRPHKADHTLAKELLEAAERKRSPPALAAPAQEELAAEDYRDELGLGAAAAAPLSSHPGASMSLQMEREVQTLYRKTRVQGERDAFRRRQAARNERQTVRRLTAKPPGNRSRAMVRVEKKLAEQRHKLQVADAGGRAHQQSSLDGGNSSTTEVEGQTEGKDEATRKSVGKIKLTIAPQGVVNGNELPERHQVALDVTSMLFGGMATMDFRPVSVKNVDVTAGGRRRSSICEVGLRRPSLPWGGGPAGGGSPGGGDGDGGGGGGGGEAPNFHYSPSHIASATSRRPSAAAAALGGGSRKGSFAGEHFSFSHTSVGSPVSLQRAASATGGRRGSDATRRGSNVSAGTAATLRLHPEPARRLSQDLLQSAAAGAALEGAPQSSPSEEARRRHSVRTQKVMRLDSIIEQSRNFIDADTASRSPATTPAAAGTARSARKPARTPTANSSPTRLKRQGTMEGGGSYLMDESGTSQDPDESGGTGRTKLRPLASFKDALFDQSGDPAGEAQHLPALENYKALQAAAASAATLAATGSLERPGSRAVLRALHREHEERRRRAREKNLDQMAHQTRSMARARGKMLRHMGSVRDGIRKKDERRKSLIQAAEAAKETVANKKARGQRNWTNLKGVLATEMTTTEKMDDGDLLLKKTQKMLNSRTENKARRQLSRGPSATSNADQESDEESLQREDFDPLRGKSPPNAVYYRARQTSPSPLAAHWSGGAAGGEVTRHLETFLAGQRRHLDTHHDDGGVERGSGGGPGAAAAGKGGFLHVAAAAAAARREQLEIEDIVAFKEWKNFHMNQCRDLKHQQHSLPILHPGSSSLGWKYKVYKGHEQPMAASDGTLIIKQKDANNRPTILQQQGSNNNAEALGNRTMIMDSALTNRNSMLAQTR